MDGGKEGDDRTGAWKLPGKNVIHVSQICGLNLSFYKGWQRFNISHMTFGVNNSLGKLNKASPAHIISF